MFDVNRKKNLKILRNVGICEKKWGIFHKNCRKFSKILQKVVSEKKSQ